MKKTTLTVAAVLLLAAMLPMQSCIGRFALSNKVLAWNNQVGSKFVNELVFFAFWVLPVYEVTMFADLVVLNSIEFWSGNNPVDEASVKVIDTDHGRYLVACDGKGYTVTCPGGEKMRLDFNENTQTWSAGMEGDELLPFMTMVDDSHVRMISPDGDFRLVELSEAGVLAYGNDCGMTPYALR